jgi:hypothetical protein
MELPTVFVVVAKSEQKPVAAYLDTAMRHCSRKIAEYENEFDIRRTQYVKSDRNE